MTELEHIEIEGFKGLEHVEFEPTDINLITGRNNTGKTSFLEAVDVFFNPEDIERFEDNIGSVINVNHSESVIQGSSEKEESELQLRHPTEEELPDYLGEVIGEMLKPASGFFFLSQGYDADSENLREEFVESMNTVFQSILNNSITPENASKIREDFLILSRDSNECVYFSSSSHSSDILEEIYDDTRDEFLNEVTEKEIEENIDLDGQFGLWSEMSDAESSKDALYALTEEIKNTDRQEFLQEPTNRGIVTFIQSTDLSNGLRTDEEDETGIKLDDISDYIKEHNLVSGFKTLTLDYLVLEDEEGEKDQIPFNFMGDGFKSIVGLLWELMDAKTKQDIVLIEEPETHMHPGYIREAVYFLINLAREENVQLFITTHDSDFINDFFTENLTEEEEAYLEDEFSLLRMEENSAVVEDYEMARENLKDLHLDLRGI